MSPTTNPCGMGGQQQLHDAQPGFRPHGGKHVGVAGDGLGVLATFHNSIILELCNNTSGFVGAVAPVNFFRGTSHRCEEPGSIRCFAGNRRSTGLEGFDYREFFAWLDFSWRTPVEQQRRAG